VRGVSASLVLVDRPVPPHPPRTGAQVRCRARRPLPAGGRAVRGM